MVEKKECPRCKGHGKVTSRTRRLAPKSHDPNFKGCAKCQTIKPLTEYYAQTPWCKVCHSRKTRIRINTPESQKKRKELHAAKKIHQLKCLYCKIDFLGYTAKQKCCSTSCNCRYINSKKTREHKALSNELREQFDNYD
jgi:hypothetical protein